MTHHGWQVIYHCLSPTLPPPDLRIQEKRFQFLMNISKQIHCHRKNSGQWRSDSGVAYANGYFFEIAAPCPLSIDCGNCSILVPNYHHFLGMKMNNKILLVWNIHIWMFKNAHLQCIIVNFINSTPIIPTVGDIPNVYKYLSDVIVSILKFICVGKGITLPFKNLTYGTGGIFPGILF